MGNRCINDISMYCQGEPQATIKTEDVIVCGRPDSDKAKKGKQRTTEDGKYLVEARTISVCELNPATCGKQQSLVIEGLPKKKKKGA